MLGGIQAAAVLTLTFRMRHLQVDQADQFKLLAEENSIKIRLLPPARGMILDRSGAVIAGNEQNYRITITPEDAGDPEMVLERLQALIPLSPEDLDRIFRPFESTKGNRGTGLGLPATRKIAREHGGDVEVSSTVGSGSEFRLWLPGPCEPLEDLSDELPQHPTLHG